MFSLRCDYRENRGGCVISLLKELRSVGHIISADKYELRDEVMTTGDYAIQCSGYIILIERKTWEDLAASIKDGRIFENHKKMLAARDQGYKIMYLIEGRAPNPDNAATKVSGIPIANMMAKLDHFSMRDGVWVEYTRSASHTALRLLELGKNLLTLDCKKTCATSISGGSQAENKNDVGPDGGATAHNESLPAVGIRPIENPDEIIKKKYEKTVGQVREAMLACVPGIGDKTARSVLMTHSFPALVKNFVTSSGQGLNTFQLSELAALAKGDRPAIVVAMLKEIKGVSEATAKRIAAEFTVTRLATRDTLTTATLGDLKPTPTGRRIGSKLAERISESWSDESVATPTTVPAIAQMVEQKAVEVVPQVVEQTVGQTVGQVVGSVVTTVGAIPLSVQPLAILSAQEEGSASTV